MNRIRYLRESIGMQQKELAIHLGVSQPTVSDWESGRKTPSAKSTLKIAEFFDVSIEYLLGGNSTPAAAPPSTPPPAADEQELLTIYRCLNPETQTILLNTARGFAGNPEMQKDTPGESAM